MDFSAAMRQRIFKRGFGPPRTHFKAFGIRFCGGTEAIFFVRSPYVDAAQMRTRRKLAVLNGPSLVKVLELRVVHAFEPARSRISPVYFPVILRGSPAAPLDIDGSCAKADKVGLHRISAIEIPIKIGIDGLIDIHTKMDIFHIA
ncbi:MULTISPECIES: hypothetical protein [unclassified Methylocaldum]|uniref:hypothetical protein n=1 Tax=unclassified Methylocaldum TaxID=2622260 RepID=UPI001B78E2BC|nr:MULTISPECIES: hypothetical protein [unclassified Methylocaldum]MBP1150802.1 hypothetical protein [Methylocaldum sp. RMAD-M]